MPSVSPAKCEAMASAGCRESRLLLSRRSLLGITASLFSAAFLPRSAEAGSAAEPRLLVVVIRGGLDGLNTVVPFGDPRYAGLRGALAIPAASTIRLNGMFGMHPALANLGKWYGLGEAAVVHAVAPPVRNRSHFDAQDSVESGLPGVASNPTGWLNRLLSALPAGDPVKSSGAIQIGGAPLLLRGPAPVLGWSPTWFQDADAELRQRVLAMYDAVDRPLYAALQRGLRSDDLADGAGGTDDGEVSQMRKAFRGAARLMRAAGGPHVAVLSIEGFDTHSGQGGVTGQLADRLGELDTALADFKTELGTLWGRTIVTCVTEFGRTARTNGDSGTDHGEATVALLAGGGINGKRVFGTWPGLAPESLSGGDLKATTDLRAVFKGVLEAHLGVPPGLLGTSIFPQSAGVGSMTSLVKPPTDAASAVPDRSRSVPAAARPPSPLLRYRLGA